MELKIGEKIAYYRKARGYTQEQLGELVGVSGQAVSKWENGGVPDTYLLPAIANALNVSINALFGTDRMLEALNKDPGADPETILRNVNEGINGFVRNAEQFDDVTMLCLEYKGKQ